MSIEKYLSLFNNIVSPYFGRTAAEAIVWNREIEQMAIIIVAIKALRKFSFKK